MSRGRWFEAEQDAEAARTHFGQAAALWERGGFERPDLDGYAAAMALMHAMQSGHTSLEASLSRCLYVVGEDLPTGRDWHADPVRRAASAVDGRPALLPPPLARAAHETRRFRHVAMHSYCDFDAARAGPAIGAARALAEGLPTAFAEFRRALEGEG